MPKKDMTAEEAKQMIEAEKNARAKRAFDLIRATLEKEQCELHFMERRVDGQLVEAQWAVVPK